jgi:hypothetical protein
VAGARKAVSQIEPEANVPLHNRIHPTNLLSRHVKNTTLQPDLRHKEPLGKQLAFEDLQTKNDNRITVRICKGGDGLPAHGSDIMSESDHWAYALIATELEHDSEHILPDVPANPTSSPVVGPQFVVC